MSEVQTAFPYDPSRISKIKTIERHKWNPDKKHIYWKMVTTSGLFRNFLVIVMSALTKIYGQVRFKNLQCLQVSFGSLIHVRSQEQWIMVH